MVAGSRVAQGLSMSAEQPNKRRRASDLGLLASSPPQPLQLSPLQPWSLQPGTAASPEALEPGIEEPKPDVFEFLAQRSQKQRELEGLVQQLQQREGELAARVQDAQRQISSLKVHQIIFDF